MDKNPMLDAALAALEKAGTRRPYDGRIEAACNQATADVIEAYGAEVGGKSEAVRELLALGAAVLAATRA